jgi:hypothetical protein
MPLPRYVVPQKTEVIVDEKGFQKNRVFRFFDELSRGAWNTAYPDTDGTITYYTVTSTPALVSLIKSSIAVYQSDDQAWLCDLNVTYTVASGARTGVTMNIDNLKFLNLANLYQPVTGYAMDGTNPYPVRCYAQINTGNIIFEHASATTTTYGFRANGLILEEQPSFA